MNWLNKLKSNLRINQLNTRVAEAEEEWAMIHERLFAAESVIKQLAENRVSCAVTLERCKEDRDNELFRRGRMG